MALKTQCPNCESFYTLADRMLGKGVHCKVCSSVFFVRQGLGELPPSTPTMWREGNRLVLAKDAPLPNICLKSNQPATRQQKFKFSWTGGDKFFILLLFCLPAVAVFFFVLAAMLTAHRATLYIPITEEWLAIRKRRITIAWGLGLLSIVIAAGAFTFESLTLGIIFLVLFSAAVIYGNFAARLFHPAGITDDYISLKGVHPDFLVELPVWPYPGTV